MFRRVNNCRMKKVISGIVFIVLMMNISGCSVSKSNGIGKNENEKSNEINPIYSMNEITTEGKEIPFAISKAKGGGIYVVTGNGTVYNNIWHIDKDDNWEKMFDVKEVIGIHQDAYCEAFITSRGEIFVEYNNEVDVNTVNPLTDGKIEYLIVDAEGKKHDISLDLPDLKRDEHSDSINGKRLKNHIESAKCIDDKVYAVDTNSNIYEINMENFTSKLVFNNTEHGYTNDFCIYNKTLMVWSDQTVCYEGIDTPDSEEKMYNMFKEYFETVKKRDIPVGMDIDKDKIWSISSDSLYVMDINSEKITKNKIVGTAQDEYVKMQVVIDETVYAIVYNYKNQESKLYKYLIDDIATDSNAKIGQLKIWVLDTSQGVEDAVSCFTDKYPNVKVEIEVGLETLDSGITVEDAIKNLNTELLSGNGPDIIYFEGVNSDKYVEAGQLYDITDIVNELKGTGDYYDNILDTFNRDNKIYVVPNGVSFLTKIGYKEAVEASKNFSNFIQYIETNNSDHNVINGNQVCHYILNEYYKHIKDNILDETISKEQLEEFFFNSKRLYELQANDTFSLNLFYMVDPSLYAAMYDGSYDFALLNVFNPMSVILCDDMVKQTDYVIEMPASDYKYNYVPRGCIAISSNSSNIDLAKEYLKVALGEECQGRVAGSIGARVNKKGNIVYSDYMYEVMKPDDKNESDRQKYEKVKKDIDINLENVNKPFVIDKMLDQIVIDELSNYIQGNTELDTAVDNTFEKCKIYLAE